MINFYRVHFNEGSVDLKDVSIFQNGVELEVIDFELKCSGDDSELVVNYRVREDGYVFLATAWTRNFEVTATPGMAT